ncbi:Zygote arrest protein 1 [Mizuhopecten yessoensis]|uniref:Zygote arrest protein 1 n=1 Tax=Mizuhopecten yessoensis TaxID=6573 RepID=A0A210PRI5_MIZYE|nr:Zygote arrest protein 1 [Mizuhopecten yessoensis]
MSGKRHYGYFRCPKCNAKWESAQVYSVSANQQEYYKQDCKNCRIACSPYKVEPLQCPNCGKPAKLCQCPKRHTDPSKGHRSDLCHKCQSGRPCY